MSVAREMVRRGVDSYTLDAYRVGEGVAWRRLMDIAFELTADPADLHVVLDVCSRSISDFVEATLAAIAAQIELERDELTRGSHAERRATVALLLDGAPIPGSAPKAAWPTDSAGTTPPPSSGSTIRTATYLNWTGPLKLSDALRAADRSACWPVPPRGGYGHQVRSMPTHWHLPPDAKSVSRSGRRAPG